MLLNQDKLGTGLSLNTALLLFNTNLTLENRDEELNMEQVAYMRESVVEREFWVAVKGLGRGLGPPLQAMIYPKL